MDVYCFLIIAYGLMVFFDVSFLIGQVQRKTGEELLDQSIAKT